MKLLARGRKRRFLLGPLLVVALLLAGWTPAVAPGRVLAATAGFSDLSSDEPLLPFVTYVSNNGLFHDYADGTFRPMNFVNRAQMAKLMCQVKHLEPYTPGQPDFSDVAPGSPSYGYIEAAAQAGIMKGYADGTFQPEALVSRAQTAALVLNLTGQSMPDIALPGGLQDVPATYWAARQIAVCLDAGIMKTDNAYSFAPDMPVTRQELARSLAVSMVLMPELNKRSLTVNLAPGSGLVTLTGADGVERVQDQPVTIGAGFTIKTGSQSQAQLLFPDGSSIMIDPRSQIEIKKLQGRRYIEQDGSTGIVIDSLGIYLFQGRISGLLAAGLFYTAGTAQSGPTTGVPWYSQAQARGERVLVDMPFGQARVAGPLWSCEVKDGGIGCGVLQGKLELTAVGQTVYLNNSMFSEIEKSGLAPSAPIPLPAAEKNQWAVDHDWMKTALDRIMANAPLDLDSGSASGNQWGSIVAYEELQKSYRDLLNAYPGLTNNTWSTSQTSQDQVDQSLTEETSLKNISFSAGTLTPAFNPQILNYTLVVPDKTGQVTLIPYLPADQIPTDHSKSHTTINIDGVIVDSGQPSSPINLSPGYPRTVSILVTAKDGSNNRTYTVMAVTPESYRYLSGWGQELALPKVHARYAAVDGNGNVFLTDAENNQVYKLDPSGKLIDRWGSKGSGSGQFDTPTGIAVDSQGFVYVADGNNSRIEKFRADGALVAQWGSPGRGDGQLSHPEGLAVDSRDIIYVADWGNSRLQKFDSQGGFLGKWGSYGSGDGQFSGPIWGVATDSWDNVYVVDAGNGGIQKFDASGNFLAKWGSPGGEAGQFLWPCGIAVDLAGNIYVTEKYTHRVQKFNKSGSLLFGWGTKGAGPGRFLSPEAIAVDSGGSVYVADGGQRMQKFTSTGQLKSELSFSTLLASEGKFYLPRGITVDKAGNLYVVDTGNDRVQKFDADGKFLLQWGSPGPEDGQFKTPRAIAVDPNGYLYVADAGNNRIQKFDAQGHFLSKMGSGGSDAASFNHPCGLAFDSAGHLFVADTGNCRILEFNVNGSLLARWGSPGSRYGQFLDPSDVCVDAADHLLVVDVNNNRIQKFDTHGSFLGSWGFAGSGFGQFNQPAGIAASRDGEVFVVDSLNNRVEKFDSQGTYITQWGAAGNGDSQFKTPAGIAVNSSGVVYVVDSGNARISKYALHP